MLPAPYHEALCAARRQRPRPQAHGTSASVQSKHGQYLKQNSSSNTKSHRPSAEASSAGTRHSYPLQTWCSLHRKRAAVRLLSKTKPGHLLRFHRALQNGVNLATAYKKLLKNHSSFASVILKGNNCIHYIKVVTKYIRRDYDPLTKSSETAAGGIKEL